jgi:putative acetyltransferase
MKAASLKSEMTGRDAVELYKLFDQHGIPVWIDGGWGVDALLGHQTRKHDDLDIALRHSDVSALRKLLEGYGYRDMPSDGSWLCNFVLGDDHDHRIDIHSFEIDVSGKNIFGVAYRAEHLTGIGMIVRIETENDWDAIREVHRLAFGRFSEANLVDDLRQSGDGLISLVAEQDQGIIGHVLFSKLEAPMKAPGLAPVAVHPSFQKQGVGSALIREGLHQAKEAGWTFIFVLGDSAYYQRFGFRVETAKGYSSPYSGDHFMAVSFGDIPKTGRIVYPKPFDLLD